MNTFPNSSRPLKSSIVFVKSIAAGNSPKARDRQTARTLCRESPHTNRERGDLRGDAR